MAKLVRQKGCITYTCWLRYIIFEIIAFEKWLLKVNLQKWVEKMQLNQYIDTRDTDLEVFTALNFCLQSIRSCMTENMAIISQALKTFWQ